MTVRALLFCLVCATPTYAAQIPNACSVTLLRNGAPQLLGSFSATVAEETTTTKTYVIPDSKLSAAVSVYYTDESVRIDVSPRYVQDLSIRIALVVSETGTEDALNSPAASIGEAAIISESKEHNLLRVMKVFTLGEGRAVIIAECEERPEPTPVY